MTVAAFINGIAVGGVAALLAVGISQIFTTSGVLNFAHAGFAMVAAYLYAWLAVTQHWSVVWAALVTLAVVSLLGTLAEWLVLRRLAEAPFITKVIVTLGLYVFMQGMTLQLFGFDPKKAPLLFHGGVSIGATVEPMATPPWNRSGAFFGSKPNSCSVMPCMKTYRPSVTMTLVMKGASVRRRSTDHSASVPSRLTATIVTRAAHPTGQDCVVASQA